MLATVVPRGSLDGASGVKGLVGQDVLASRRYTIHFGERPMHWHGAGLPVSGAEALPLRLQGERFVVNLPQGTRALRMVPDSGSEALVLFDRGDGGCRPPRSWARRNCPR